MTPQLANTDSSHDYTTQAVLDAVREFIMRQFPAARTRKISDDDSLLVGGVVDSLGILEVVTFIEQEFDLTVTDDEFLSDRFESISRIAGLICEKQAGKKSTWTS